MIKVGDHPTSEERLSASSEGRTQESCAITKNERAIGLNFMKRLVASVADKCEIVMKSIRS